MMTSAFEICAYSSFLPHIHAIIADNKLRLPLPHIIHAIVTFRAFD